MSSKLLKIIAFTALLIFYGSFLLYEIDLTAADDLPRQMKNGEDVLRGRFDVLTKNVYSYTEPEQTFANHHWGSGVVFYVMHLAAGYNGMVVFKVIIQLCTFALLFYVATRKADFWLVMFLSLPALIILLQRTSFRPEMFSYFFITLYLYLLTDIEEHPEHNRIFWLIPVQLAWVNMHIFFVAGILLVGGFLFEKIVRRQAVAKKLALLLVCIVVVSFINPFGLKSALTGFKLSPSDDSPIASAETVSVKESLKTEPAAHNLPIAIYPSLVIMTMLSFVAGFWKKPGVWLRGMPIFYFLASVGTAGLGYYVVRALPLFGLVFLPAASGNLSRVYDVVRNKLGNRHSGVSYSLSRLLPLFLVGILLYFTFFSRERIVPFGEIGVGVSAYSEEPAKFFKKHGLEGPIFNDTDIGSYIIGNLYPRERVFLDNRFRDAYSAYFFKDIYYPILIEETAWQSAFASYGFNVIFLNHYDGVKGMRGFIWRRMHDPDWALIYADTNVIMLVRNNEANRNLIERFHITDSNAGDKLRHLTESDDPDEVIAGADLLALIGRTDLATSIYLQVVARWPARSKVWLVLGKMELLRQDLSNSNPALALMYIKQAIAQGRATPEAYSYLALAYFRLGDLTRAREAVDEELRIDPDNQDGKDWLVNLEKAEAER